MTKQTSPDPDFILRGSGAPITSLLHGQNLSSKSSGHGLISGNMDGYIHFWDLKTRRPRHALHAHPGYSVLSLHETGPGELCSLGRDGFVHIWTAAGADWHVKGKSHIYCKPRNIHRFKIWRFGDSELLSLYNIMPSPGTKVCGLF